MPIGTATSRQPRCQSRDEYDDQCVRLARYHDACAAHATDNDRLIHAAREQGWHEGWRDGSEWQRRSLRRAKDEIADLRAELARMSMVGTS